MRLDVIAVMERQQRLLGSLGKSLGFIEDSPSCRVRFDEFAKACGGMLRAIDLTVLPLLKRHGWREISSQLLHEHFELKDKFSALLTTPFGTEAYRLALSDALENLARQQVLSASHLFPWFRDNLDEYQRVSLGREVQQNLTDIMGEPRRDFDESEPAISLLEQAKLVLGSLPGLTVDGKYLTNSRASTQSAGKRVS